MKQDNQFDHTKFQWQVIDKVATPISPNAKNIGGFMVVPGKEARDTWEQFAYAHQFATNAEPGFYEGKEFKEPYLQTFFDGEWERVTYPVLDLLVAYPDRMFLEYIGEVKEVPNTERGLYGKYHIQKRSKDGLVPVDKEAEYFVLRLDVNSGNDIEHIKACRIGIHAYAEAIKHHLPKLAADLKNRYPLID